jgi:hypothetical protein
LPSIMQEVLESANPPLPSARKQLRSRGIPETMRRSRSAPLADLPEGVSCCGSMVSVQAGELPYCQPFFPGTTAWRISYRRRDAVEGVNGALKGAFVNIGQKFLKVFGLVKIKVLLAFILAAYNLETIRSFLAKKAAKARTAAKHQSKRKKRRKGTWTQILGSTDRSAADPLGSGRAPPPS